MAEITGNAYAKLNYTLDVLGKREDGYHDLSSIMQTVSLCDEITVSLEPGEPSIRVRTDREDLPEGEDNLAGRAVRAFWEALEVPRQTVSVEIRKRIPACAGMAGGSSDAAFVLCALDHLYRSELFLGEIAEIGAHVGSDVPYCVFGGTMLAEGRGEKLYPVAPGPRCHVVLCKPDFPVSTPELYCALDVRPVTKHPDNKGLLRGLEDLDVGAVARNLYNVFESVLPEPQRQAVLAIKKELAELGALGASMTGSGPTVFGLFEEAEPAARAADALKERYAETFLTTTVDPGYY